MEMSMGKRCCCCIPLSYGLLTWGYFKLITASALLAVVFYMITIFGFASLYIMTSSALLIIIGLTIGFIYAMHNRDYKLLRTYFYCSIVENILGALLVGGLALITITLTVKTGRLYVEIFTVPLMVIISIGIVFQSYIILLIRNAVIKMKERDEYKSLTYAYDDDEMYQ